MVFLLPDDLWFWDDLRPLLRECFSNLGLGEPHIPGRVSSLREFLNRGDHM